MASTITLDPSSDLRYQGAVRFIVSTDEHLKGNEWLMVYCAAYQADVLVYGQLARAEETFILGGGSSAWVSAGGGAAECGASLWVYSRKGERKLADCAPFQAAA